jgi:hypothetical protein
MLPNAKLINQQNNQFSDDTPTISHTRNTAEDQNHDIFNSMNS